MLVAEKANNTSSWHASLELVYEDRLTKTALTGKKHTGPLMVQKPFYPESNGCCHTYLIHPPGGIVGGDKLHMSVQVNKNAHALITTPGATKFYRSDGRLAQQEQTINLEENALLEWLPQETVYFNDANADSITKINTHETSRFMAWEIQCLGLPAQKEFFESGHCLQKFQIWREQKPILLETNRLIGGDNSLSANWGMQDFQSIGTFIISDNENIIKRDTIKELANTHKELEIGFTSTQGLFIVRALGFYAQSIKNLFICIWQSLRPNTLGFDASLPRIWNT